MDVLRIIHNTNYYVGIIIDIICFLATFFSWRKKYSDNNKSNGNRRKRTIYIVSLVVEVLVGCLLFLLVIYSENIVEVPNVVGLSVDNAKQTLNESKLSFKVEDDDNKIDVVKQQFPAAGSFVYVNQVIYLELEDKKTVVNKEAEEQPVSMPTLYYLQEESALELLYSLGAGDVDINYVYHDDINAGLVLDTTPAVGESFYKGDTVVITVSKNKYDESKLSLPTELYEDFVIEGKCLLWYNGDDSVVTVPEGIEVIGKAAFDHETNSENSYDKITQIILPDSVKLIEPNAFREIENLESINIPNGVKCIPSLAFTDCSNLHEVKLSDNLMYIGPDAFHNCNNLKTITIPKCVKYIGEKAFSQSGLTKIELPDGVIVKEGAFLNCNQLEEVIYEENMLTVESGCFACTKWLDDNEEEFVTVSNRLLRYNGVSETVVIPENIEIIDAFAFTNNKTIKKVVINENVTEIGDQSFLECSNLREVELAESISKIGAGAFMHTEWLENYPNDYVIVGDMVLISYKGNESEVEIPDTVKIIGRQAFSFNDCSKIIIPESVETINSAAFMLCSNLAEIEIPDNIEVIPRRMCYLCPQLKSISMPEKVRVIGEEAFSNCQLLECIILPSKVKIISKFAFDGCDQLEKLSINDGCRYICSGSFTNCRVLEAVYIPRTIIKIGEYAFFCCTQLREVTMNYGVQYLGEGTFAVCTSLHDISLPMSIVEVGLGCFMDCYNLQTVRCCGNIKEIKMNTFKGCSNLAEIKLSENLEKIGYSAFYKCINLREIDLSDSMKIIGESAFRESGIEEISIPNNVKMIDLGAFFECYNLKTVKMKEGTEKILAYAFAGCDDLVSIYFPDSITFLDGYIGGNENTIFYCSKNNKVVCEYASAYGIKTRDF